jgi:hypothetical protein
MHRADHPLSRGKTISTPASLAALAWIQSWTIYPNKRSFSRSRSSRISKSNATKSSSVPASGSTSSPFRATGLTQAGLTLFGPEPGEHYSPILASVGLETGMWWKQLAAGNPALAVRG